MIRGIPSLRAAALLFATIALGGCAAHGTVERGAPVPGAGIERVFVESVRAPAPPPVEFGWARAERPAWRSYDVSIPPGHRPGRIEWPTGRADASRHFVAVASRTYPSRRHMLAEIDRALAGRPAAAREIVLYVHGFNVRFGESLYRTAQLAHDFRLPGAAVAFAWASAGSPVAYVHDRESVLVARDALAGLIAALAAPRPGRVVLVAHSLGAQLTMEALRQLALSGRRGAVDAIAGVVLIAPDIDVDVFRAQMQRIGPRRWPLVVVGSRADRALALSARLGGGRGTRLGEVTDAGALSGLGVTLVDLSKVSGRDPLNHATAFTSPAVIGMLRNARGLAATLSRARGGVLALGPKAALARY